MINSHFLKHLNEADTPDSYNYFVILVVHNPSCEANFTVQSNYLKKYEILKRCTLLSSQANFYSFVRDIYFTVAKYIFFFM